MHLLEHAPQFDLETAREIAVSEYDIHADATPLPSERDQNFLLTTDSGEKFVLKIANALEDRTQLEAQEQALQHLATKLSFCPRLVPARSGQFLTQLPSDNLVRVVTYLPGIPLAEVTPHSLETLRDLGEKLGQLDQALRDFDHTATHRKFHWDLAHGLQIIHEYQELIANPRLLELVGQFARNFARDTANLLPTLRRSVIHGDANDYNVLVDPDKQAICGLIDFGDMVHSYTVADLAIAIAYVVLDKPDPLPIAAQVVSGYAEHYPLAENELASLFGLVLLRLCMSVCLAAEQTRQRPENEYLQVSQQSIADSLPALLEIDLAVAKYTFREVLSK
jgi:Ser/Thr protein kinase RdoA (MazF antagonist)